MRASSCAFFAFVAAAAASGIPTAGPTESPGRCTCPPPSDIADVILDAPGGAPATPLHAASDPSTGIVYGAPWTWIPQDGVELQPFQAELRTLSCGHYYGWACRRVENGTVIKVDCKTGTCDVYVFLYHEPPRSSNTNGRLPQTLPPDWEASSCAPSFCIENPTGSGPLEERARKGKAQQLLPTQSPTASPGQQCCRMTAFRRQVDGSDSVNFTIDEIFGTMDAYYLLIAVAPGERCDSNGRQDSREACEAQPDCANAACRWVPGTAPAKEDEHPLVRTAKGLQILPTASPTGSPAAGRCVPNWCPRVPRDGPAPPVCNAPLTEPECPTGPSANVPQVTPERRSASSAAATASLSAAVTVPPTDAPTAEELVGSCFSYEYDSDFCGVNAPGGCSCDPDYCSRAVGKDGKDVLAGCCPDWLGCYVPGTD